METAQKATHTLGVIISAEETARQKPTPRSKSQKRSQPREIRFRVEQETPVQRTKKSNLEFDLLYYPQKKVVYRMILDGKSSRSIFNGKVVKVTSNPISEEKGK